MARIVEVFNSQWKPGTRGFVNVEHVSSFLVGAVNGKPATISLSGNGMAGVSLLPLAENRHLVDLLHTEFVEVFDHKWEPGIRGFVNIERLSSIVVGQANGGVISLGGDDTSAFEPLPLADNARFMAAMESLVKGSAVSTPTEPHR